MYELEIYDSIPKFCIAALENGLNADAASKLVPPYRPEPFCVLQRDAGGKIVGGLTGQFTWDWLFVDMLYVEASEQKQGLGARLLAEAETAARARGCAGIWLWTESFQAPGFYQKQGFEIFCRFPDFPRGHQRIGLRKIFSAQQSERKAG